MKLLLVRHGQTIWNTQMRTQGHTDIELNDIGRRQADSIARRLSHMQIDAVYASPLSRAMNTARTIAEQQGIEAISHPLLMERNFGIWEGEPFRMLLEKYPDQVLQWENDPVLYTPPEAEPLSDVLDRCKRFLLEVGETYSEEQTVLVIGHSIPLRLMIAYLIGMPPQRIHSLRLDNAAYTELRLGKNYPILTVLNDTSHLD